MPRGGPRVGAGRKSKAKIPFAAKAQAQTVLSKLGHEFKGKKLPAEDDIWITLLFAQDNRLRFDVLRYLTDRRDGKPSQKEELKFDPNAPLRVIVEQIGGKA